MSDWWGRMVALFSTKPDLPADTNRVTLDDEEQRLALRLSKLRGVERDEVLSEAYRRARLLDDSESYHRGR